MGTEQVLLESEAKGDKAHSEIVEDVWESPNTASQFWSYTLLSDVFVLSAPKTAASFQREYLHLNLMQREKKTTYFFPESIIGLDSSFALIPLKQKSQRLNSRDDVSHHDLRACLIPDQKYKSASFDMHKKQLLNVLKMLEFKPLHDSITDTLMKAERNTKRRYCFNSS